MSVEMLERTDVAAPKPQVQDKLTIFAWSGELDKIWPTLILATTGAAMGKETTIFFTFWGLFPLVKNDVRITGENWMQKMLSMMNRGGDEHLKLTKMNFIGAGPAMMGHLAREHHVASPHELMEIAKDLGVHLVPCQMTMDLMGLKKEDLIDGLEEPAGATKALADAQGGMTLFI
ncbi:MAG TPA: DsrE/DsrF/DrsH-like family protein [Candidatus Dormibacteraeota bacterium]|nr:DsrE/DsrF/DrsH-like family protein [Candidatus Dormibacteraeota bacterium]